jgi:hypothetical protein
MQAFFNLERAVHVRIINQAFPADGAARFFKVHPHHQAQGVLHLLCQCLEAFAVIDGSGGIVDGAGTNDNKQPFVLALENIFNGFTPIEDGLRKASGVISLEQETIFRFSMRLSVMVLPVLWASGSARRD